MGREVRRVPANWKHPMRDCHHSPWRGGCDTALKNGGKCYQPIRDTDFETAAKEWKEAFLKWESGLREDYANGGWKPRESDHNYEYWQYAGNPPDEEYYRPKWTDEERTHFQLYETVSEGTPLSPPMPSIEALARWCADNGASAGPYSTLDYEGWLKFCQAGWAPSGIVTPTSGGLISGAEAIAKGII